jgi:hypothetical protein
MDCAIIFTNTAILNKKLEKLAVIFVSPAPTHSILGQYSACICKESGEIAGLTRGFSACCP